LDDYDAKPRPKHELKELSQHWRCNWDARCPITESQRWRPLTVHRTFFLSSRL